MKKATIRLWVIQKIKTIMGSSTKQQFV